MVSGITKHSSVSSINNIKSTLDYAIKTKAGYYKDLQSVDKTAGKTVKEFGTLGFINTRHTNKSKTYGITK